MVVILYEKKELMLLKRVYHWKPYFSKASFEAPERDLKKENGQAFVQGVGWLALLQVTNDCSVDVWEDHHMCHAFIIPFTYLDFWLQETDLKSDSICRLSTVI